MPELMTALFRNFSQCELHDADKGKARADTSRSTKPTRRSTFKVRTGCTTCKKRHIKCDETKPYCNNCLRISGHCEGYVVDPEKVPGPVQLCWDSRRTARGSGLRTPAHQSVEARDFHDTMAMLYFQEFVDLVQGPWISAASSTELWEVTLPQLARNNDILRCIAVGIGALSRCHRQFPPRHPRPNLEENTHYLSAVKYYCQSLKLLGQRTSVQEAVFISVLLLFFELLRGERKAALNHLNHGLALMLTLLTDDNAQHLLYSLAPDPKPLLLSVAGIHTLLAPQARFVLHGSTGQDRPLPHFTRGLKIKDLSMESFIVRLGQLHPRPASSQMVPSTFRNIEEFEEHWMSLRRRNLAVGSMGAKLLQSSGVLGSKEGNIIDDFYYDLLQDPEIKQFCQSSRQAMQAVDAAFLPLFNRIVMTESDSPTFLKAVHLRLQFLQVYAFENPPQYLSAETLHAQTPLFREYLSLARVALRIAQQRISNSACQISLECGISWHLLLVAFFCRDALTRDEAVQMLREYPCQDGLWNPQSLYTLALKSQAVERTNATEGSSTEQWRRLWRREYVFEDGGDRIVFRYQDKDEETGAWQMVEEVADVGEDFHPGPWTRRAVTGFGTLMMGDLVPT